jgi:hypothetical protein
LAFQEKDRSQANRGPHPDVNANVEFWNAIYKESPCLSLYEIEVHDVVHDPIRSLDGQTETVSRVKEYMYLLFIERERIGAKRYVKTTMNISFHQNHQDFKREVIFVVNKLKER